MNIKSILITVVVAAIVAAVGVTYFAPTSTTIKETIKEVAKENPKLGAIAGDSVDGQRFCIGGVCKYYSSGACAVGTSTLVSILPPSGATSTIASMKMYGNTGTTSLYVRAGTSTDSSINNFKTNQLSPTFMQFLLATSTGFFVQDRVFAGAGPTSTVSAFSNATTSGFNGKFIVGGQERLTFHATGTSPGWNSTEMQSLTNTNTTLSCKYSVEWESLNN